MSLPTDSGSGHARAITIASTDRKPTTFTIPDPASVEEYGRTFNAYREGKYYLPNDGDEQDRLDVQHKCWLLLMKGELYWAPIENPKNVLDVGTGTGIWAIDFARKHPEAHVTGTDLSLIQPSTTPPNCDFVRDDIEDPWIFHKPFDFVHLRVMFSCFDDPRAVLQKIYDHMEPGGWVEYQDTAMEITGSDPVTDEYIRASSLARWIDLFKAGLRSATGRTPEVALSYAKWMKEIGFVDVVERPFLIPINSWPLDPDDQLLGKFVRLDMEKVVDSSVKLLLAGGMTQGELPAFKEAVKWSLGDCNMRGYYVDHIVYGRKPLAQTELDNNLSMSI